MYYVSSLVTGDRTAVRVLSSNPMQVHTCDTGAHTGVWYISPLGCIKMREVFAAIVIAVSQTLYAVSSQQPLIMQNQTRQLN